MNTQQKQAGFMEDAQGRLVPMDNVKPEHKLEDQMVMDLIKSAAETQEVLKAFKDMAFADIGVFVDLMAEKYGVTKGGKKGNMTFTSYDGKFKVSVSVAEFIQFGSELQIAKDLIDDCILEWSANSNHNIAALVNHAFRVDKNNRLNVQNILGLRRLNIEDENWQTAMQAITDSIRIANTKSYVRIYQRPKPDADWKQISLDIAKV